MEVMMKMPLGLVCLVSTLLLAAPGVQAHGWIETPLARQFCNGAKLMNEVSIAGGNGARTNRADPLGGVPGLCGDPFASNAEDPPSNFEALPCEPQETYPAGGVMSMHIDIAANHGGVWEVSVCDRKDISQACFDQNKLKTVEHNSEQYWMQSKKIDNPSTADPDAYMVDWKLPEGLTCEHCVVQWTWWAMHKCFAPLFDGQPCDQEVCGAYADMKNPITKPDATWDFKYCETAYPSPGQEPQMFRNCADIKIGAGGAPTPPADAPAEPPVDATAELPVESPTEPPTDAPAEPPVDAAVDTTTTDAGATTDADNCGTFMAPACTEGPPCKEEGLTVSTDDQFLGEKICRPGSGDADADADMDMQTDTDSGDAQEDPEPTTSTTTAAPVGPEDDTTFEDGSGVLNSLTKPDEETFFEEEDGAGAEAKQEQPDVLEGSGDCDPPPLDGFFCSDTGRERKTKNRDRKAQNRTRKPKGRKLI